MTLSAKGDIEAINLPQKRKFSFEVIGENNQRRAYETLSLIAYEGSALTVLGLVKFDPFANNGEGAF